METHELECGDELPAPIADTRPRPPAMVVRMHSKSSMTATAAQK